MPYRRQRRIAGARRWLDWAFPSASSVGIPLPVAGVLRTIATSALGPAILPFVHIAPTGHGPAVWSLAVCNPYMVCCVTQQTGKATPMAREKPKRPPKRLEQPRTVRVKPHSYQLNKAELDAPVNIDATPDQLARAVLRPVRVVHDSDA